MTGPAERPDGKWISDFLLTWADEQDAREARAKPKKLPRTRKRWIAREAQRPGHWLYSNLDEDGHPDPTWGEMMRSQSLPMITPEERERRAVASAGAEAAFRAGLRRKDISAEESMTAEGRALARAEI